MTLSEIWKAWKAYKTVKKETAHMSISELKTSEGRMTLLLNLVAIYSAVKGFLPPVLAAKIAVASIGAYTIARSLVKAAEAIAKMTNNTKDDAIVAEAERILDVVDPSKPAPVKP